MSNVVSLIPEKAHSALSPSGFGRIASCTASYLISPPKGAPTPSDTIYSATGTALHEIAEKALRGETEPFEHIGDVFTVGEHEIQIDGEMADRVESYVSYCRALQDRYLDSWTEQNLRLPYVKEILGVPAWGHIDFLAVDLKQAIPVIVVDYKSGRIGVPADSWQNFLYGLAAVRHHIKEDIRYWKPDRAIMQTVIAQPKGDDGEPIKEHIWTVEEFLERLKLFKEILTDLRNGVLRYVVGDHCRFCPIIASCPSLRAVANDAALAEVLDEHVLLASGDMSAEILDRNLEIAAVLKLWASQTEAVGKRYLEAGGRLESRKMVPGRASREWIDADKAKAEIEDHGVDPHIHTFMSPAQAEKAIGKTGPAALKPLIRRIPGAPTMAPRDDKREEVRLDTARLRATLKGSNALEALKSFEADQQAKASKT